MKVCDAYGAGYFYIPGSDTCLKIGGVLWLQTSVFGPDKAWTGNRGALASNIFGWQRGRNGFGTIARADLMIDSRTSTELGLLRSFMELVFDDFSYNALGNTNSYINQAYVQFAGLTAGRAQSFYDFITAAAGPYTLSSTSTPMPLARINLLAYTFALGNGISTSISIEDPTTAGNGNPVTSANVRRLGAYPAVNGGLHSPDLIGNINWTQSWGAVQLSGALHNDDGSEASGAQSSKLGYAVLGGVKVNLPSLGPQDVFAIEGSYAQGAPGYVVAGWQSGVSGTIATAAVRDFEVAGGAIRQSKAWGVYGAFTHGWTKQLASTLGVGYASFDSYNDAADYKQLDVRGNLAWTPVGGFTVTGEVSYLGGAYSDVAKAAGVRNDNRTNFDLRIQRSF